MGGCGTFFLFIIFIAIAIFVLAGVQTLAKPEKKVPYTLVAALIVIALFFVTKASCDSSARTEKIQKDAEAANEIETIKQNMAKNGVLGMSEHDVTKIYGPPSNEFKVGTDPSGYGIYVLSYPFGNVTVVNQRIIKAPAMASGKSDSEWKQVESLKTRRGTIRKGMTSDQFVSIVSAEAVTDQAVEPDVALPESLKVNKFCKIGDQEFQVVLRRTTDPGPYRITALFVKAGPKGK